jgi:hypothetical protein
MVKNIEAELCIIEYLGFFFAALLIPDSATNHREHISSTIRNKHFVNNIKLLLW